MSPISGPAPGFISRPEHGMHISASDSRWSARREGVFLADSRNALILQEANYKPVVYFPLSDINVEELSPTLSETTCPYKGTASYLAFSAAKGGPDIAWTYPETYDEASAIAGYMAFYADRVDIVES